MKKIILSITDWLRYSHVPLLQSYFRSWKKYMTFNDSVNLQHYFSFHGCFGDHTESSKKLYAAQKPDLILNVLALIFTVTTLPSAAFSYTLFGSLFETLILSFPPSFSFISWHLVRAWTEEKKRKEKKVGTCLEPGPLCNTSYNPTE